MLPTKPSYICTTHHKIYLMSTYSTPVLPRDLSRKMSSANATAVSAFIEGAPPGEVGFPSSSAPAKAENRPLQLGDVISDIKSLTGPDSASLLKAVEPAFRKYAEAQLLTAKLLSPSGVKTVCYSHLWICSSAGIERSR